ncbi:Uncharacterized protein HDE_05416 [Halotydeus destructor]|nr:Uncharacterized protein HDE_05416 [Halotydeus destructor]
MPTGIARRGTDLTRPEELNYLIGWFREFSEMQKSDFFKIILKKYGGNTIDSVLIEAALKDMVIGDKPPSIFLCRMKLFDDWFANWSDEEKEDLLIRLKNLDSSFMDIFQQTLDGKTIDEEIFRQPILQLSPVTDVNEKLRINGNCSVSGVDSTVSSPSPDDEKNVAQAENQTDDTVAATNATVAASDATESPETA